MTDAILEIQDLALHMGKRQLHSEITLSLAAGERLALIGPNGVGKSTLLKTVLGLLPYQTGNIQIQDQELSALDEQERARLVAYVPQQSHIEFPVPVQDVVSWARYAQSGFGRLSAEDREIVKRCLAEFGLTAVAERNVQTLSGGEQRRVLLARAAASQAPLILCDEPTAHLDMKHMLGLDDALARLCNNGRAVLMVLHDLRDAERFADRVLLMGHNEVHGPSDLQGLLDAQLVQDVYGVSIEQREQYYFF